METGFLVGLIVGPVVMLLVLGICVGASSGRIPRNRTVGLRLPSTLESDAAWRRGHRSGRVPALVGAIVLVLGDVAALALRAGGASADPLSAALVALLVLAVVAVGIAAHRGARAPGRRA